MIWQLAGLLVRTHVFRAVLVGVSIVSLGAGLAGSLASALTLSPTQQNEKLYGATEGTVQTWEAARPGQYPPRPAWLHVDGVEVLPYYLSSIAASDGVSSTNWAYAETAMPSPVTQHRFELISGRWPSDPGECLTVGSAPVAELHVTAGELPLTITGTGLDVYSPDSETLMCAPGTWGTWQGTDTAQFESNEITADYFLDGDQDTVDHLLGELLTAGHINPWMASTPSGAVFATPTPQRFLALYSVAAALCICVPLAASGLLSKWVGQVQLALKRAGVRPSLMKRAVILSLVAATATTAVLGAVLGALLGGAVRPALEVFHEGPLGPFRLGPLWIALIVALCLAGALVGFLLQDVTRRLQSRQIASESRPLTPQALRRFDLLGGALLIASVGTIAMSDGRLWPMMVGVLILVLAVGAYAPHLLLLICRHVLSRATTSPSDLAGRLMTEDGRRWGAVAASATVLVAALMAVFVNVSSSAAAEQELLASPVPEGTVLVETRSPDGTEPPPEVLRDLESQTGTRHAASLEDSAWGVDGEGLVQLFDTIDDALRVFPSLDDDTTIALQSGHLIKLGVANHEVTLTDGNGSSQRIQVHGFRPDPTDRLATGYGFALKQALPTRDADVSSWWVFKGIDQMHQAALENWPTQTGNSALVVRGYTEPAGGSLPGWLTIGFGAICLLAVPLFTWTLQREVRALKPVAATLDAMGLPRRWVFRVLLSVAVTIIATPLTLAIASAVISTGVLQLAYPTIFNLSGASWPAVAGLTGALLLAAGLGAWNSSRRVRTQDKSVLI